MKNLTLLISFLLGLLFACNDVVREKGNGNMITRESNIGYFEEVNVSGNFEIILRQGESPGLLITADENLHKFIEVESSGDRLEIKTTKSLSSNDGLVLEVTYKELTAIEVGGAATITSEEPIVGDYLNVTMSGAGAIDLEVNLKVLKTSVSGAGAVDFKGIADEHYIQMSGAGGLDAYNLQSKVCEVNISGVGGANIFVTESLAANVSGVGSISYKGNPQSVKKEVSGLGSIDRTDDENK